MRGGHDFQSMGSQAAFGSKLQVRQDRDCTIRFCAGMMQIDENDLSDVWIQSDDDFSSESWARQMERLDGDMLLKDLVKLSSRQARVPCAHMRKAGVAGRCVFSVCRS